MADMLPFELDGVTVTVHPFALRRSIAAAQGRDEDDPRVTRHLARLITALLRADAARRSVRFHSLSPADQQRCLGDFSRALTGVVAAAAGPPRGRPAKMNLAEQQEFRDDFLFCLEGLTSVHEILGRGGERAVLWATVQQEQPELACLAEKAGLAAEWLAEPPSARLNTPRKMAAYLLWRLKYTQYTVTVIERMARGIAPRHTGAHERK